jgi:hypothetical protein
MPSSWRAPLGAPAETETEITSLARRRFDRFAETLEAVFEDADVTTRLAQAGVVVRIDLTDLPGAVATLMLDRAPAEFAIRSMPARPDVRLHMRSADLEAMFREGEYLPMQILSGAVTFEGYVRKFLRVLPILCHAASQATSATEPA